MAIVNVPEEDITVVFTEYNQQSRMLKGRPLRTKQIKHISDTLPPDLLRYDDHFREHVNSRILYEDNGRLTIIYVSETLTQIQSTFNTIKGK